MDLLWSLLYVANFCVNFFYKWYNWLVNIRILYQKVLCTLFISIIVCKVKYPLRFIVSYFQPIAQQYESRTVWKDQSNHYEKYRCLLCKGSHHVLPPNRHFTVSKDEWNTNEDTGTECIVCTVVCQKVPLGWSDAELQKIKSMALAIIKLCLSEGISQSVT